MKEAVVRMMGTLFTDTVKRGLPITIAAILLLVAGGVFIILMQLVKKWRTGEWDKAIVRGMAKATIIGLILDTVLMVAYIGLFI